MGNCGWIDVAARDGQGRTQRHSLALAAVLAIASSTSAWAASSSDFSSAADGAASAASSAAGRSGCSACRRRTSHLRSVIGDSLFHTSEAICLMSFDGDSGG
jgi:hypothetical protein